MAAAGASDAPPAAVSDAELALRLRAVLQTSDLSCTTERAIRKRLEEEMGADLTERKAFIRSQVRTALNVGARSHAPCPARAEVLTGPPPRRWRRFCWSRRPLRLRRRRRRRLSRAARARSARAEEAFPRRRATLERPPCRSRPRASTQARAPARVCVRRAVRSAPGAADPSLLVALSQVLSEQMAAFMGAPEARRNEVVKRLWEHIKANALNVRLSSLLITSRSGLTRRRVWRRARRAATRSAAMTRCGCVAARVSCCTLR